MAKCQNCSHEVAGGSPRCSQCGALLPPSPGGSSLFATDAPTAPPRGDQSPAPDDAELHHYLPGSMLDDRYRMIERVGSGGMGEVYRAQDLKLGQTVAIKFIRPGRNRGPASTELFLAEARLARQIGHPNVCRVYDIGETHGVQFLSMEFVDGEDLASLLRRIGRLPTDKATEIAREICAGLAAVHDRDVIHRDLKPGNVMIDGRGHARITDFGLASLQGDSGNGGAVVGTPAYMAPEVRDGHAASMQSDVYSLGLVLFETYTGEQPSEAREVLEPRRHAREGARRVQASAAARGLDPALVRLILRCLEPDPARRPASAIEVATALPGGDPIAAAIAAGRTPEPELLAAAGSARRALKPAAGRALMALFVAGLASVITLAPRTRVVSAVPFPESPAAMEVRARLTLSGLGFPQPRDHQGWFRPDVGYLERTAAADRTAGRWERLTRAWPPVVLYRYRESPRPLDPADLSQDVAYSDPAPLVPGMVGLDLDTKGRLRRLDAVPTAETNSLPTEPRWAVLFAAAGLDSATFTRMPPLAVPPVFADARAAWEGPSADDARGPRVRVEAAAYAGRPIFFSVAPVWAESWQSPQRGRDDVAHVSAIVRSTLLLVAFLVAAWLARRNLRAGRGDRRGALRVASTLLGLRMLVWMLGAHHTVSGFPREFAVALSWSLYDFALARVFYLAIEPYVRRLWPHVLVTWVRVLDGRQGDPLVGRDLLLGCLLGLALSLGVAAHQAMPALLGLPPGRPDNVGFVEPTLAGLMGVPQLVAQLLLLYRSAVVTVLGFFVVLVASRLLFRSSWLAFVTALIVFLPYGMPRGELVGLNLGFALCFALVTLLVLMRIGLLAAAVGLMVHSTLQASALSWHLAAWPGNTSWLGLALVLGIGTYGLVRAMGGRLPVLAPLE